MDGNAEKDGAVRGAEHRSSCREHSKSDRDGSRSPSAVQGRTVARAGASEKHRAVRFARCESDHRVRCLAFLVTFWAMPKS